jgi:polyisoprenoid-binding protein YceI
MTRFKAICLILAAVWMTASAQTQTVGAVKDESTVTYTMTHPLHTFDAVSKDVYYRADIDAVKKEIKKVVAQVDVTTFDSKNSNRDSHAMEVIDAISFPYVTFTSTSVVQTGDSLQVAGKLTFHGVTKDIVLHGTTNWTQDKLVVDGKFVLSLTEFKIERPSLLLMPVSDDLHFELKAAFTIK